MCARVACSLAQELLCQTQNPRTQSAGERRHAGGTFMPPTSRRTSAAAPLPLSTPSPPPRIAMGFGDPPPAPLPAMRSPEACCTSIAADGRARSPGACCTSIAAAGATRRSARAALRARIAAAEDASNVYTEVAPDRGRKRMLNRWRHV